MEEIYLNRLSTFANNIKDLSDKALSLCSFSSWNDNQLEQARITISKLTSIINRFNTELYQYFNQSVCPNADEISTLTSIQLEGEEALAELNARVQASKDLQPSTSSLNSFRGKLPELHLPTFKGDVLEWFQFWDQFSSNIDQRNLRDVDKLLYLKASLKGEAKTVIDGLETTNDNYKIAVTTLKERYGKGVQIIDAHYSTLYKLKRAEKPEDCRKTLDEIERHLRVLRSLGENTDHNHLRFLIMEKFPEDIIYEMKMKMSTETIEEMRKQLNVIISAREDAKRAFETTNNEVHYTAETLHTRDECSKRFFNRSKFDRNGNKGPKNYRHKTSAFNTSSIPKKRQHDLKAETSDNNLNKRKKLTCAFCHEAHYSDKCTKFKTMAERKSKLIQRCFNCFQTGHRANHCKRKEKCPYCSKYGNHNRALCPKNIYNNNGPTKTLHVSGKSLTFLQTAVVKVIGQDGNFKKCRLLLDSGSQRSYVTQKIARDLNLRIEEENHLTVFTFGSKKPQELDSSLVKLNIETKTNKIKTIFANVVPSITHGIPHPEQELIGWNDKEKYVLADDGSLSDHIDILLGNDYYYSFMFTHKLQIQENLYLIDSELGWILSGKTENKYRDELSVLTYFQSSCENKLNEPDPPLDNGYVKRLWDLESIGIYDSPKTDRDEEAIKHFNENTTFEENRYVVSWPWNEYPPDLQTNFGLAFGRLVSLLKRVDSKTLSAYNQTLDDQFNKGIIELAPFERNINHPIHYLPHHGILAPGKALRIVYDASAKTKNSKSLNECLYCGPMMLEDLTGLLIKFRCHPVGLTADVEKAFLQIGLHETDRDVTRFLWLKDTTKPANENNLVHFRFTRVPFGIISSPFLLNATIRHHLQRSGNEHVRKLSNDVYVDNVLTGVNTAQEAMDLYKESKAAFQDISMNLREWSSNSKEFMDATPDACHDEIVKVLGLDWHIKNDILCLRFMNKGSDLNTKRGVLKVIASVYDPCGFAVPHVLAAKLFLQELWMNNIKWDTPLSKEMTNKWIDIRKELDDIRDISVGRCYIKNENEDQYELHCFTDSSTKAYAACIYLVNGSNRRFVMGKSRLVPIKDKDNLKIPRLELLGVLIGSRLIKYVLRFLQQDIAKQTLWTDSQIAIDWCKSDKLLPPFIARRVEEIKKNQKLDIRYVPSELNPADVGTRPTSSKENRIKWLHGPQFLSESPDTWPSRLHVENTYSLSTGEGLPKTDEPSEIENLELTNTSKDVTIDPVASKGKDFNENSIVKEIRNLQLQSFSDEVKGKKTHLTKNLGLFIDVDGLLRCDGRLTHSDLSYEAKHPILLPKDCKFTANVIKEAHEKHYHVGVAHTLNIVRQQYWIPQGRAQVKKVISKCSKCIKHGGGPYALPDTPALPAERVKYTSSFAYVGVDYFGPMLVTTDDGKRKRWICLFTCLVVRAIHLEIVKDLTAEECLLAFRRFIACRGVPTLIVTDNALQFKLLSEVIAGENLSTPRIKWKFIPELAPWHGGVYERLVAVIKHCLKRTLQKHLLNDNQLLTIIKEVEAVANSRPLTYVGTDLEHVLKPADFLSPGRCLAIHMSTDHVLPSATTTKRQLIEGWKRGEMIMDEYREMFMNQYLPSLRERYRHSPKQPRVRAHNDPSLGDIVQLKGDSKNRENWKVGRIVELVKGADGLCRVAKIKIGNNIFTRSIGHLYPLEVDETETPGNLSCNNVEPETKSRAHGMDIEENLDAPAVLVEELINLQPKTNETADNINVTDMNTGMTQTLEEETTESTDKTTENMDVTNDNDEMENEPEQSIEDNQKRLAAVRAREKIREWTRHLMTTLTLV